MTIGIARGVARPLDTLPIVVQCLPRHAMAFFKITLAYDGTDFSGWQAQPGRRTVQGELERAWLEITGEAVRLNVAGRTDAGVHAAGQVAGVESGTQIAPLALLLALNAKLPDDAAVLAVEPAADGFHATHDATRKRYRYAVFNDPRRPVFERRYAWHIPTTLDVSAMSRAGGLLVGTHDFASFQSVGSERESTVRTIFAVDVIQSRAGQGGACFPPMDAEDSLAAEAMTRGVKTPVETPDNGRIVAIEVEGDGFLYNMVRAIAGTLVEVGRGKRDPSSIGEVLTARNRCAAGQTAPPHGLTLMRVEY